VISRSSVRARLFRPAFSGFGRGLIVAFPALAFFTVFEVSDLRARSAAQPSVETVNRTLKGDRLSYFRAHRCCSMRELRLICLMQMH
jgi:hypothetical protein